MASTQTIHLADRDDARRRAIARGLRGYGFEVLEFVRGTELFERAFAAPPDLIVAALDLDVIDGFQVVDWLRRRRPETQGRVLFLTAGADAELAQACMQRGALACLDGELPAERLAAAIETAISRGASRLWADPAFVAPAGSRPPPSLRTAADEPTVTDTTLDESPARATAPGWRPASAGAPADTQPVSRAAEERAAIVALRERWHARDRQRAKRGAGGPRVSRSTVGAFLAVIALIMTAGFGLAVFQSPGLPALVERLDRLRVVAVERFSQTLLDLQQSKISIEPLGPAGAGPTGAPSDAGSAGAHLRARKVVDEGASGIRKAGTDGERLAANADGVGFAGGVREPEGVVEQNESPVAAPDLPFGAPIAPVPVMPVSPVAPDATTGTGDRGGQSLAAIRARPRFVFVDTPPSLRARLRPQYPEALAGRAIGGTVTLWVLVSETGKVEGVRVLRSSGQPELDEAAADAVWLASYTPAQRGGAPVPTWTQQAVTFRLD